MSSIISGGAGRAYGYNNIMISPLTATSSITSHSSSSKSSTLSDSTNSSVSIWNRKPRTPRKRPNQTYNEAAVLLSIACPKVFSTKNITNNNNNYSKFTKQNGNSSHDTPELLLPFPVTENPCFVPKPGSFFGSKMVNSRPSPPEFEYRNRDSGSGLSSVELCDAFGDDFETESMLDEEIEQGIDSIIGNLDPTNDNSCLDSKICYGFPMGLGFGRNLEFNFGIGMRNGTRALKNRDGGNWWGFPTVNVMNLSQPVAVEAVAPLKVKKAPVEKKKKPESEWELGQGKLLLKLNYDDVLNAWSGKGSPLPGEISGSESPGGDIHSKLAQIDLFSENDGLREAGVTRYKEKKRTHLFAKKIRYQVRKVNADRRPRSKRRFVRRPNSATCEDT